MHRVDTEGSTGGVWQDGNPGIGQQGTVMSADWLNDMQGNLCDVVESAGIALEKGNIHQLKLAIAAMINTAKTDIIAATRTPVGTIIQVDAADVPAGGYVRINTEYLRATYPDLVAFYTAQGRLIAGSTGAHFRTPNYEGRFSRATSTDNAVDPDGPRAPGSLQADEFKGHDHSIPARDNANAGDGNVEDGDSSGTARNTRTGSAGGAETRGKNVALSWFIKT